MITMKRRLASAVLATALATSFGIEASWAQGATVGPAGGLPSNSAPSNSQGTPAGGTGVVGGGTMPMTGSQSGMTGGSSMSSDTTGSMSTPRRHVRRVRHRAHRARPADTSMDSAQ